LRSSVITDEEDCLKLVNY